jgi:outer membrane protein assembly factor BamB
MARYDAAQDGYNPFEHVLAPNVVWGLHLEGELRLGAPFSDYTAGPPVVSGGVVYVTGYGLKKTAYVYAFPAACGAVLSACAPLWTAAVGNDSEPKVAVANGVVVVAGDDAGSPYPYGELYAFPVGCRSDGGACPAMWSARFPDYIPFQLAPTVADGVVYVAGDYEPSIFRNYLFAFPLHCGTGSITCRPLWRGQMDLGAVYESVAVSGGIAYVSDYDGWVYGYRTDCSTTDALCRPVWSGYTGELGPAAPAVADGEVVVGSQDDDVYAFPARCSLSCAPRWIGHTSHNVRSDPAIADGVVYITSDDGKLYAFWTGCSGTCSPLWTATLAPGVDSIYSSPAVADGVVYVAWADVGVQVAAFAAGLSCTEPCKPLWTGTAGHYESWDSTVAQGELWESGGPAAGPGTVYAFGLGAGT